MVGHRPLEASILVRIQVPQPNFKLKICVEISRFRRELLSFTLFTPTAPVRYNTSTIFINLLFNFQTRVKKI